MKTSEVTGLIYQKIPAVMAKISSIGKDKTNTVQKYKFRGIDDVYNALHPILSEEKIFTVPIVLEDRTEDRKSNSGGNLIYRVLKIEFRFYAEDGSYVSAIVIGEGMDSGDKASNKAMAVGHKYALLQTFCIPTEEPKDPENDSPEAKSLADSKKPETPKPETPKPETFQASNPLHLEGLRKIFPADKQALFPEVVRLMDGKLKGLNAMKQAIIQAEAIETSKEHAQLDKENLF